MKSFQQFVTEATYDKDIQKVRSQIKKTWHEGGRIRASRKKDRADMPSRLCKR